MTETESIIRSNVDHSFFSWAKQGGLHPLVIDRAEGVYIYSSHGKRILDFSSQLMLVNIGHGHPAVLEAVQAQMKAAL